MESTEESSDRTRMERLELFAVLLMALTAVMTAWSAFESSKWGGVMSTDFSAAGAARTESTRQTDIANAVTSLDAGLVISYVEAIGDDNEPLADFLRERFPEHLAVATTAWLKTEPLTNADAPSSPLAMDEYVVVERAEAIRLQEKADGLSADARDANQKGDNYTITSVLFATVILLAALSSKVRSARTATVLIGMATVLFVGAVAVIATFPIEI